MEWALPEWTVAAGALGRGWQIPRPVVYRALSRLVDAGHAAPTAVASGPGPRRTVHALTAAGESAVDTWLAEPVRHVRQLRSHLLMKPALLDRRGLPAAGLLAAQRAALRPIAESMAAERAAGKGFDAVLLAWRYHNVTAALRFLDEIS